MAQRFPGLARCRGGSAAATSMYDVRRRRHRAAAWLRRRRRLLARAPVSKPWLARHRRADAGAQRAQRSVHSGGVAARRPSRSARAVTLEQPAHGGHAGFATAPFPGRLEWLPRAPATILRAQRNNDRSRAGACVRSRVHAPDPLDSPMQPSRRNLQGLRHPRHRRQDADRRRRARGRPGARLAGAGARPRHARRRPRRPTVGTGACRRARRRHPRQRRERHRHRHGHDADDLLRRASSATRSAA